MSVTMSTFVFLNEQTTSYKRVEFRLQFKSPEKKMVKVREGNFCKRNRRRVDLYIRIYIYIQIFSCMMTIYFSLKHFAKGFHPESCHFLRP